MHNVDRLHRELGAADIRATLTDLRRKAWETLLDLGLTEEEIAAYYGMDGGPERPGSGRDAALRQGMPLR